MPLLGKNSPLCFFEASIAVVFACMPMFVSIILHSSKPCFFVQFVDTYSIVDIRQSEELFQGKTVVDTDAPTSFAAIRAKQFIHTIWFPRMDFISDLPLKAMIPCAFYLIRLNFIGFIHKLEMRIFTTLIKVFL